MCVEMTSVWDIQILKYYCVSSKSGLKYRFGNHRRVSKIAHEEYGRREES